MHSEGELVAAGHHDVPRGLVHDRLVRPGRGQPRAAEQERELGSAQRHVVALHVGLELAAAEHVGDLERAENERRRARDWLLRSSGCFVPNVLDGVGLDLVELDKRALHPWPALCQELRHARLGQRQLHQRLQRSDVLEVLRPSLHERRGWQLGQQRQVPERHLVLVSVQNAGELVRLVAFDVKMMLD
ncbi:hypothetical protein FI667_g6806, partial [Globisporangium splendens]